MNLSKNKGPTHSNYTETEYFDFIPIKETPDTAIDEALYKKLEQEFGDKPKRELREKLQQIGEEYYVNFDEAALQSDLETLEKGLTIAEELKLLEREESVHDSNHYIQRIIQGDPATLKEIYAKYSNRITALIMRHHGSRQDAQDVLQDALLVIFEKARQQKLELTCAFYTYLHAVCYNIWRNRQSKASYKDISLDALEFVHLPSLDDIHGLLQKQDQRNIFWDVFGTLKEKDQKLLHLSFEGHSSEETRKAMEYSSLEYTRKRICITKKKLVKLIKKDPRFKEMND